MKSVLCLSFATSSSRHSQTCAPKWRRRRLRAAHVATGSPACACDASWRPAPATPRGQSRSHPCRTLASAPRRPAGKTRTPHQRLRPRPLHAHALSKTNCGRCSMSYREKECDYEMKQNSYVASSMIGNPAIPWRSRLRELSRRVCAARARTRAACAPSETRCCCVLPSWRRRRPPAPPRLPPAVLRWVGWTPRWTHRLVRRASPRLTPRSSRRFSSRAILSNFRGSCSPPPFKIRYAFIS